MQDVDEFVPSSDVHFGAEYKDMHTGKCPSLCTASGHMIAVMCFTVGHMSLRSR